MAKAMWKGAISFGMVVIPVRMYIAVRSRAVTFRFLHKKCLTKPRQMRYCELDDEYFGSEETVKGFEYAKGQYIVLKESDFEKVPVKSLHTIEISAFVAANAIDPVYYKAAYYLEPEEIAAKPFALLRQALVKTSRMGLAKVTFAKREHLCCLRPIEGAISLHTLHYAEEIVPLTELDVTPPHADVKSSELELALSLMNAMARDFNPQEYKDEYRQALKKLVTAKLEGQELKAPRAPEPKVPDLMAALRASVESAITQAESKPRSPSSARGRSKG